LARTALTGLVRLSYPNGDDEPDRHRFFPDRAPLVVVWLHLCGAFARLIGLPNGCPPANRQAFFR